MEEYKNIQKATFGRTIIEKILQKTIGDRVGYQDRFCEIQLEKGLEECKIELTTYVQSEYQRGRDDMKHIIEERIRILANDIWNINGKYTHNQLDKIIKHTLLKDD